ncbi:hypothetical protein PUN28_019626 [Cardiocondyla obscurior]|uniref:Uncharacterized protein n=1 Tax=Cardiocondyla obscurior TaxID=286306 RepID=A0AAW2E9M4_9HYME
MRASRVTTGPWLRRLRRRRSVAMDLTERQNSDCISSTTYYTSGYRTALLFFL